MIDLGAHRNRRYAVMGLDKSGLSTVRALLAGGAEVFAWDDKPAQNEAARELGATVTDLTTVRPQDFAALVLSPGIPHHLPKPHAVAAHFLAAGIAVTSDIELFASTHPVARIVGITGTNGKSTTTALVGHILKIAGRTVAVGGNIGIPVLDLDPLNSDGVYVLELSSYQLERCPSLHVDIGVMLNLTPDHLARHGDMEGYAAAKALLFKNPRPDAIAIFNDGDAWTTAVGARAVNAGFRPLHISTRQQGAPIDVSAVGGQLCHRDRFLLDLTGVTTLPGAHNWENATAATATALALGLSHDAIVAGLTTSAGLPHRQQHLAEWQGLRFVNDSKATNASSAAKALACYDNIYWIAGGQPKEGGLNGLEDFAPRIRRAFLIGAAEADFSQWCDGRVPFERCGTLANAVKRAADAAQADRLAGATILLSPACASWDQFRSFEHRGETFAGLVDELTHSGPAKRSA